MQEIKCPHCHFGVPYGAKVCRGCGAEIEYGTPGEALLCVFIASLAAGLYLGLSVHRIVGWVVFFVLLALGFYGCHRLFRSRINFKRRYLTK